MSNQNDPTRPSRLTIKVSLKEEHEHQGDSDSDDDDSVEEKADLNETSVAKKQDAKKRKTKGNKKLASKASKKAKARRNPRSRRGRGTDRPRAIIDPGSDFNIIGGVGWEVLSSVNKSTRISGALSGMGDKKLPIVCAVTVCDHPTKGPLLIGVGEAAWDEDPSQMESLFNSHHLRKFGVVVDDVSERDGGLSKIELDGIEIKLDFVDESMLSFYHRKPTEKELVKLKVHWLVPRSSSVETGHSFRPTRRAPADVVPEEPLDWRTKLGNCPEFVAAKTLEATTQLCKAPVEMENRENPCQHRKQRLLALHPSDQGED